MINFFEQAYMYLNPFFTVRLQEPFTSTSRRGPGTCISRYLFSLLLTVAAGGVIVTSAFGDPAADDPVNGRSARKAAGHHQAGASAPRRESYSSGWSLFLDNDLLVAQDGEYTGGIGIALSGRRARKWFFSLDPVLGLLNDLTGVSGLARGPSSVTRHSFEIGATAFTPEDIEIEEPIEDDRPYAGLVFVSNARQRIHPEQQVAYQSVFSLGLLGTGLLPALQDVTHDITGSDDPEGWENQISDGGEPTFLYEIRRQDLLYTRRDSGFYDIDFKSTVGGSVGYITELEAGLNVRLGRITSSPWGFTPNFGDYINRGVPVNRKTQANPFPHELFIWGGIQARLRGYNALIEGQFRDSEVTFDRGELREVIGEANLGVTCGFQTGTRVSVGVRAQTPEIIDAEGSRPIWGTLVVSHAY